MWPIVDENREDFMHIPKRRKLPSPDYEYEVSFEESNAGSEQFTEKFLEKLSSREYWLQINTIKTSITDLVHKIKVGYKPSN